MSSSLKINYDNKADNISRYTRGKRIDKYRNLKRNCNKVRSFIVGLLDYYFAIVFLYLAVIRAYRKTYESHADRHELAERTVMDAKKKIAH